MEWVLPLRHISSKEVQQQYFIDKTNQKKNSCLKKLVDKWSEEITRNKSNSNMKLLRRFSAEILSY